MTLRYEFDDLARVELDEVTELLERERPGWGTRFALDAQSAIGLVCDAPAIGALINRTGRRRVLLEGFPYAVIYRVTGEAIRVLAVAHHRRRPDYFRSRT